jgi:hypothetical protein
MPVRKNEGIKLVKRHQKSLLDAIGSHSKFLLGLLKEDDWSFVIKSHALIEAVMTQLVTQHAADPRFKAIFERLPISDEEIGKIAIAKQLDLLTPGQRRFIRFYSRLRNDLVHKVANVHFEFRKHLSGFDKAQRVAWRDSIVWFVEPSDESHAAWNTMAIDSPKIALWMAIFMLVALSEVSTTQTTSMKELHELALKTGEEVFASRKPK